jgi:hypothetical protein
MAAMRFPQLVEGEESNGVLYRVSPARPVPGAMRRIVPAFPNPRIVAGATALLLALATTSRAAEITAVYSEVSRDYVRARAPDGSFRPEGYAFGNGGFAGGPAVDASIDGMKFLDVLRTVAKPLASQNFIPSKVAERTHLLIMVYWGTTPGKDDLSSSDAFKSSMAGLATPPMTQLSSQTIAKEEATAMTPDSQMNVAVAVDNEAIAHQKAEDLDGMLYGSHVENEQRDQADAKNAMILGYYPEMVATAGLEHSALGAHRHDLIEDLEYDRYYVVLMAYDFQGILKHKQRKLLWVTRISIRARGNKFGTVLPAMTDYASRYFGRDSHGLLREVLPDGHVNVGPLKSLGVEGGK